MLAYRNNGAIQAMAARFVGYLMLLGIGALAGLVALRVIPDLIAFAAIHGQMRVVTYVAR